MPTPGDLDAKRAALELLLREMDSVVVAYSGGVDSSVVLRVAHQVEQDIERFRPQGHRRAVAQQCALLKIEPE